MSFPYYTNPPQHNTIQAVVDNLIFHVVARYIEPNRVRTDVLHALSHLQGYLRPEAGSIRLGNATFNLVKIAGTIPANFRGSNYNVPIAMYLPLGYPQQRPIVYVTPTPQMRIKQNHPHVDSSGVVYLPYLSSWHKQCNIIGISNALKRVFSKDPAVRAKPGTSVPYPLATSTQTNGYAQTTANSAVPHPRYNSFPNHSTSAPMSTGVPQNTFNSAQYARGAVSSPQLPVYPSSHPGQTPTQNPNVQNATHNHTPIRTMPTQPHMPTQQTIPQPAPQPQLAPTFSQPTLTPQVVEDPAKARERTLRHALDMKIEERLKDFQNNIGDSVEKGFSESKDYEHAQQLYGEEKNKILNSIENLDSKMEQLQKQIVESRAWIEQNDKNLDDVDIDEVTNPEQPLKRQYYELMAEDLAIDDTQYELKVAWKDGNLKTDTFVKLYSKLSRDQFYKRALIQKIKSQAGPFL
mmetsp:Transcript_14670/g.16280  ORF Transcript_14670/g.16280 Transcript_14670/m.16280 type:complete len:463 (+) Transcript_14670:23-1411(+)